MAITDDELENLELHDSIQDLKPMSIEMECSASRNQGETTSTQSSKNTAFLIFLIVGVAALAIVIFDDYQHHGKTTEYMPLGVSSSASDPHSNHNRASSFSNLTNTPDFSILPRRIYSIIGLESSGTQFVSRIIAEGVKNGTSYREGSQYCGKDNHHNCNEYDDIMVQHFSLPWGSTCQRDTNPPVIDVVVPSQCTRKQTLKSEIEQCNEITQDIWGFARDGAATNYPKRYQLDIVSHKEWYDAHGVEQFFIIVVRDQTISSTARSKHCNNQSLKDGEEEVGTDIIVNAINEYILADGEKNVTKDTYKFWVAEKFQHLRKGRRKLGTLPFGNNVALVSYESLIKLGPTYVQMLYEVLGIDTDYIPQVEDGNAKYIKRAPK